MGSVVSTVATAINFFCDVAKLSESIDCLARSTEISENSLLETASVVNSLALLGFSIAEIGAILSGQKSEQLAKLKKIELIPRIANFPIQYSLQVKQISSEGIEGLRGFTRLIEKGIVAPLADLSRVSAAAAAYDAQHFLEMNPEELKTAKQPVYSTEGDIIGEKPVDLETCRVDLAQAQSTHLSATAFRVCSELRIAERILCDVATPTFRALAEFFAPIPPDHPEEEETEKADLNINLLEYERIPRPLLDDRVFQEHVCPITQEPIRDPVRDPTNGITLYERKAIVAWLQIHPVSPITQQPLTPDQLITDEHVKGVIEQRLQEYQEGFMEFIHRQSIS